MNQDQKKRGIGRGALLRILLADATDSSISDESQLDNQANVTASSSSSNTSLSENSREASNTFCESGYRSNTVLDSSRVSSASTLSNVRSQGRGRLLEKILQASNSLSHDTFQISAAAKPFGSGRGRMFQMLRESGNQSSSDTNSEDTFDQNLVTIDEGVTDLSLSSTELEPVIRIGTKGKCFKCDMFENAF